MLRVGSRGRKMRTIETNAYHLSPKLIKQLKIDEKMKDAAQKEDDADKLSTDGMTTAQVI